MALAPRFPVTQTFLAVTDAAGGQSVVFSKKMGYLTLYNTGSDSVWFTLDATAPVAADADGRSQLPAGSTLELDGLSFTTLKAITAAGKTSGLQIIAMDAPR